MEEILKISIQGDTASFEAAVARIDQILGRIETGVEKADASFSGLQKTLSSFSSNASLVAAGAQKIISSIKGISDATSTVSFQKIDLKAAIDTSGLKAVVVPVTADVRDAQAKINGLKPPTLHVPTLIDKFTFSDIPVLKMAAQVGRIDIVAPQIPLIKIPIQAERLTIPIGAVPTVVVPVKVERLTIPAPIIPAIEIPVRVEKVSVLTPKIPPIEVLVDTARARLELEQFRTTIKPITLQISVDEASIQSRLQTFNRSLQIDASVSTASIDKLTAAIQAAKRDIQSLSATPIKIPLLIERVEVPRVEIPAIKVPVIAESLKINPASIPPVSVPVEAKTFTIPKPVIPTITIPVRADTVDLVVPKVPPIQVILDTTQAKVQYDRFAASLRPITLEIIANTEGIQEKLNVFNKAIRIDASVSTASLDHLQAVVLQARKDIQALSDIPISLKVEPVKPPTLKAIEVPLVVDASAIIQKLSAFKQAIEIDAVVNTASLDRLETQIQEAKTQLNTLSREPVRIPVEIERITIPAVNVPTVKVPVEAERLIINSPVVPKISVPVEASTFAIPTPLIPVVKVPVQTEKVTLQLPPIPTIVVPVRVEKFSIPSIAVPTLTVPLEPGRLVIPVPPPIDVKLNTELIQQDFKLRPVEIQVVANTTDLQRQLSEFNKTIGVNATINVSAIENIRTLVNEARRDIQSFSLTPLRLTVEVEKIETPKLTIPPVKVPLEAERLVIPTPSIPKIIVPVEAKTFTIPTPLIPVVRVPVEAEKINLVLPQIPTIVVPVEVEKFQIPKIAIPVLTVPLEPGKLIIPQPPPVDVKLNTELIQQDFRLRPVEIQVIANTTDLQRQLETFNRTVNVSASINVSSIDNLRSLIDKTKRDIESLSSLPLKINVPVVTVPLKAGELVIPTPPPVQVKLNTELIQEDFKLRPVEIQVVADTSGLQRQLSEFNRTVNVSATINTASIENIRTLVNEAKKDIQAFSLTPLRLTVQVEKIEAPRITLPPFKVPVQAERLVISDVAIPKILVPIEAKSFTVPVPLIPVIKVPVEPEKINLVLPPIPTIVVPVRVESFEVPKIAIPTLVVPLQPGKLVIPAPPPVPVQLDTDALTQQFKLRPIEVQILADTDALKNQLSAFDRAVNVNVSINTAAIDNLRTLVEAAKKEIQSFSLTPLRVPVEVESITLPKVEIPTIHVPVVAEKLTIPTVAIPTLVVPLKAGELIIPRPVIPPIALQLDTSALEQRLQVKPIQVHIITDIGELQNQLNAFTKAISVTTVVNTSSLDNLRELVDKAKAEIESITVAPIKLTVEVEKIIIPDGVIPIIKATIIAGKIDVPKKEPIVLDAVVEVGKVNLPPTSVPPLIVPFSIENFQAEIQKIKQNLAGVHFSLPALNTTAIVTATKQVEHSLATIKRPSVDATLAIVNLSRVVQDAGFGFIAISNNLNPALESFQQLSKQAKEAGVSVGSVLLKSLTGAGGLGLALSVVTTALTFATVGFGAWAHGLKGAGEAASKAAQANEALKKTMQDAFSSVAQEAAKVEVLVTTLQRETLTRKQRVEAIEELQQLAPAYFNTLNAEKFTIDQLTVSYNRYLASLQNAAEGRVLEKQLDKIIERRLELQKILDQNGGKIAEQSRQFIIDPATGQKVQKIVLDTYDTELARTQNQNELNGLLGQEETILKRLAQLKPPDLTKPLKEIKTPKLDKTQFNFFEHFFDVKPPEEQIEKQLEEMFQVAHDFAEKNIDLFRVKVGEKFVDLSELARISDRKEVVQVGKKIWDSIQRGLVQFKPPKINFEEIVNLVPKLEDTDQRLNFLFEKFRDSVQQRFDEGLHVTLLTPDMLKSLDDFQKRFEAFGKNLPEIDFSRLLDLSSLNKFLSKALVIEDFRKQFTEAGFDLPTIDLSKIVDDEVLRKKLSDDLKLLQTEAQFVSDALTPAFQDMFDTLLQGGNAVEAFGETLINSMRKLIAQLAAQAVLAGILTAFIPGANFAKIFAKLSGLSGLFHFSKGGKVPGSGNRDTVPALLTPGEIVLNKQQSKEFEAALKETKLGDTTKNFKSALRELTSSFTTQLQSLGIQSGDIFPSSINGIQINFQQKELPQMQPIVNNILITQKLRGRDIVLGIARENQSQRKTT